MLRELFIENLAIIEQASIEFRPGLNVLTGETGAGKSLLVGALELVLGERARGDWIRSGSEDARVEALFDLPGTPEVRAILQEAGLAPGDDLLVRRTVSRSGKNRVHINDRAATLGLLESLGRALVDIHGQHEHQSLLHTRRHRELVDLFGGFVPLRDEVAGGVRKLKDLQGELARLEEEYRRRFSERDLALHQSREISGAGLRPGEEEELELERKKLLHGQRLRGLCEEAEQALYSDRNAVVDTIAHQHKRLLEAAGLDPQLQGPADQLETARAYLEEVATQLRDYTAGLEEDPARLDPIEERLALIHRLKRKYQLSVPELLEREEDLARQIESLDHFEELRRARNEQIAETRRVLFEAVKTLSRKRKAAARTLESRMKAELAAVGMKEAGFRVEILAVPAEGEERPEEGIRFQDYRVEASGMDRVEFLICPNPGQEFRPLRRIASGGELSRIMLALRNVLHRADGLPTVVFDEVDAGIGGAEAEAVGARLKRLSRDVQVLCITHLPQIAVFGDTHLKVHKELGDRQTRFLIASLDGESREDEIARMLGGKRITDRTRAHAREMIRRGQEEVEP
jgi:DNA repair protein RecN (Recombination protein N)